MSILIQNGTIVTATDLYRGNVYVEGEAVSQLGTSLSLPADRVIDATGKYVIPGGIDVHTHFAMPYEGTVSADDFLSGTTAAAHGGTTTVVDFAIQDPGSSIRQGWETWMAKAEGQAVIDYGFHMILREFSSDIASEMAALVGEGVTSFKVFMAYPGAFMLDDGVIFQIMQRAGELGALASVHAENGAVIDVLIKQARARGQRAVKYHALTRPPRTESEATHRAIALAEMANAPVYIVHLSTAEALAEVTEARDRGLSVFGETCPQYLFLSDERYEEQEGEKYVVTPPLRGQCVQADLWRGIAGNDLQVVATDHCPYSMAEKRSGRDFSQIPTGAPGVETRLSLLYDGGVRAGRISLNRWVEITSTAPAKIFGLFPRKGTIAPGTDADLVVFDPDASKVLSASALQTRADNHPFEGRRVTGLPHTVISRGRVVVEGGAFVGTKGGGVYLRRSTQG